MTPLENHQATPWLEALEHLPKQWRQTAQQTGFLKGLRVNKTPEAALRLMLLHTSAGLSLMQTAAQAQCEGLDKMSDVALLKRLKKSEAFVSKLCQDMLGDANGKHVLVDATDVRESGPTGSLWRFHYALRFPELACGQVELTSTVGEGTGESFTHFTFEKDDVVFGDRGYSHARGIAHVRACGAHCCVRVNPHVLRLNTPEGARFDLMAHLATLPEPGQAAAWEVAVEDPETKTALPGRLIAQRKQDAALPASEARVREKCRKNKTSPSQDTLEQNHYILLFTTLGAQTHPLEALLQLYRLRWQIELCFKRLKSLLCLGQLPKRDPAACRAWLLWKMFTALFTERLLAAADQGCGFSPWGARPCFWPFTGGNAGAGEGRGAGETAAQTGQLLACIPIYVDAVAVLHPSTPRVGTSACTLATASGVACSLPSKTSNAR
jgi:hypothetical protein